MVPYRLPRARSDHVPAILLEEGIRTLRGISFSFPMSFLEETKKKGRALTSEGMPAQTNRLSNRKHSN